jgi:glycosyltransferase 2 family protein
LLRTSLWVVIRPTRMNNRYSWLTFSLVLTIAALGLSVAYQDHERMLSSLRAIGWQGFLFLCLFSSFNYFLRYLRWNYLLRILGDTVTPLESLLCYLSGFAFTTTPAKVGEVVRCFYFKRRHGVEYSHTLAGLLCERTLDALAGIMIAVLALNLYENVRWIGATFTLCVVVVVFLLVEQKLLLRLLNVFRNIRIRFVQQLLELVPRLLARANQLFAPKPFATGMVIGLFAWSAEALAFAWLAHELGGHGSIVLYMSIFCASIIAGALTFVPGGLGGTEVVLYMLSVATGMGEAEALTATILIRLASLWYAVVLGLLSLLWMELNPVRFIDNDINTGPGD